ncbi:MAG: phosphopentomutase [Syntrophaceticus sp.]|nr:phosphopentomutase [Syntrophaceticus sp.]MDD3314953.1 phosphopentomutase [Syntrophaceticus sp.]MDD4359748.1 phosphopentomutase [Syntrophaceticus sp.]MDD4782774.1 phosphopentomutase [Syntrophaceticus sp.]
MKKHILDRKCRRAMIIVMDGVGVGELPDAADFGDSGSCTLGNLAAEVGGLHLPHLGKLGLGNIISIEGIPPAAEPQAAYGRMAMQSPGKDSTSGHWEMTGLILSTPFPTYPEGFPPEVIIPFEERIGRKVLGNKVASGTVIIEELGAQHIETGYPIVYTSADSVFQIAAHEEVIPVSELYDICAAARELLTGRHGVGRVIARPFVGEPGNFTRSTRRHDFSVSPPGPTLLNTLNDAHYQVVAVGKVNDLFAGSGVTSAVSAAGNEEIFSKAVAAFNELDKGVVFATLVDFDTLYGHRNNPQGFVEALEQFDSWLPRILTVLQEGDIIVLTADHGCDPTTPSTDHSREYVPLLIAGDIVRPVSLGVRSTMADMGATLAALFGVEQLQGTPITEFIEG